MALGSPGPATLSEEVPDRLVGDPCRLVQVLTNLISNAIKFTEKGSVLVRIALHKAKDDASQLRIDVVDTGIGIEHEDLATLFQPFTQLTAGAAFGNRGSGLGWLSAKLLSPIWEALLVLQANLERVLPFLSSCLTKSSLMPVLLTQIDSTL